MTACSPILAFGAPTFRPSSTRRFAARALMPEALRWRSAHYRQSSFSVIAGCHQSGPNCEHLPRDRASVWISPRAVLMEGRMVSIHVDIAKLEWRPGSAKYGPVAIHDGNEILQSAILSDPRQQHGRLHLSSNGRPPPGYLF